jgi:hemolysin expression modulating protein
MEMTKKDWLFKLRRITERESLEKIIEKKYYELSDAELAVF